MNNDHLLRYYYNAKQTVYNNGYFHEIYWHEKIDIKNISNQVFLSEYAWVVLSSGMKESIIKNKFSLLSQVFYNWSDTLLIHKKQRELKIKALKVFNHSAKISALFFMAEYLNYNCVSVEIKKIKELGFEYLERFPFLGPATSLHFAKNLGFIISKPDRHLLRISKKFGYNCPFSFCKEIAKETGEKESVIDIVLWRYATLNKNYLLDSNA
ncbi:MAG TPA: hypothetical protein VGQ09_21315 [Chitinophagaceae bacterium]|jgi:hypothetical protein|nr:hypothetical protein [Chitinophagaceae bacterium]